jgi:hypothetical protein
LPGPVSNVAFLSRKLIIDSSHESDNVVLYTDIPVDAILVNGFRLVHQYRTSDHVYVWFNISPLIKFGAENTIELNIRANPQAVQLNSVEIRYYDKGFFP